MKNWIKKEDTLKKSSTPKKDYNPKKMVKEDLKKKDGGKVKNSPVPASQLPYRKPSVKEVTSGGVPIEKRLQNSKTSPEALLKTRLKNKFQKGGGLSRKEDYGKESKPYPSVSKKEFAGGDRSYPIPTKADATDALKLAGLHNRPDVKAKVYKKYPALKKEKGGEMPKQGDTAAVYKKGAELKAKYGKSKN